MDILKYADINPEEAKHMAQRLHRKKDELNLVRKFVSVDSVEAADDERSLVARVSTPDRDRDGEIVEPKGIDFSNYAKNPCLLWAHKYDMPAIGKALWTKVDDKGLICKFQFAPTQFADEIYQLYKGGYQRAFSIGFIPVDFDSKEKVYSKVQLLEVSAVPVPANQEALVMEAYAKGIIKSAELKKDLDISDPAPASDPEPAVEAKADEPVTKPEVTENYVRIPVSDGHDEHKIRTITVSEKDGIKGLYCVDCQKVITYLFDADKWSKDEAEKWVAEHRDDKAKDAPAPPAPEVPYVTTWSTPALDSLIEEMHLVQAEIAMLHAELAEIRAKAPDPESPVAVEAVEPPPAPAPTPVPPAEEIDILDLFDDDMPEVNEDINLDDYIKSPEYKRTIAEAVEIALAKLQGKVI